MLQFSEARDLHIQQAELATMAFLERNPKDFDNSDLLKLLFLKPALAKAQDERVTPAKPRLPAAPGQPKVRTDRI